MKRLIVLFPVLILSLIVFSQRVTKEEAMQIGERFYKQKAEVFNLEKSNPVVESEAIIESSNGNESIYAFNYSDGGFVLVSADRRAAPVLAYSFEAAFDVNNIAPATQLWIDKYLEQYDLIVDNDVAADARLIQMWDEIRNGNLPDAKNVKGVDKLIQTRWNQNSPYNYYCPEHPQGPGGHVYAGCVATTMAQVMKYWNYPEIGRGTAQYFWGTYIEVDFNDVEYRWEEMTTSINTLSKEAIAELIYHCGVSVGMDYGYDGSGSSISNSLFALKQNFRYRSGVTEEEMYMYETDEWKFLLKEDLDKGQPIIYRGTDDGGNGHAFVCDGYQDTSYFHFNWGWGGAADGFYYLDPINPQMDFHWGQGALINLAPNYAEYCNSMVYNQLAWTFNDGSGPNYYFNNQNCDWLISLTDHDVEFIKLNFVKFNTLPGDVLYLYEGNSDAGTLIGEFSANDIPTEIFVYSDEVYFKFVTNSEGQSDGWEVMYETSVLGSDNVLSSASVNVYPNPANDVLNISGVLDSFEYQIVDLSGKLIISGNNNSCIDVSELASGVYFAKISNSDIVEVIRFVKQ